VLGSLSVELWRAFCIVSLIRLDLSSWVAVLVVATAYGASQLSTTIATAAGASTVAAAAGFLFVKTGSLLAPLTMSLIAAGVHFYRVRYISIGQSRYLTKCGVCSATFHPSEVEAPFFTPNFPCPKCGEQLEYEYPVRHVLANAVFSGLVALGLPFEGCDVRFERSRRFAGCLPPGNLYFRRYRPNASGSTQKQPSEICAGWETISQLVQTNR